MGKNYYHSLLTESFNPTLGAPDGCESMATGQGITMGRYIATTIQVVCHITSAMKRRITEG